jgi:Tol biopolymer transport system component/serine/threonine protein kinase
LPFDASTRLGPYEIVALLRAGDAGEVYKATDTRVNRPVVLRTLPKPWTDDPEIKPRLDAEAQAIAGLSHPNICTLHEIGEAVASRSPAASPESPVDSPETVRFLVSEYLEGETLAKRLERGALPVREAVRIAIDITDALASAHQKGIIHRSLRPSNVMLCENGARSTLREPQGRPELSRRAKGPLQAKLLDFGLAPAAAASQPSSKPQWSMRTTRTNMLAPSVPTSVLQYMAPEQIEMAAVDARADIFAFGAMFYEMVTGAKVFEGKNRAMLIAAIASLDLDPLSKTKPAVPPALDHVAGRCLEKDPDDRWQTAHDLNLQLRWIAGGGATLPGTDSGSRRRVVVAAAVVVLLATALATPALMYFRGQPAAEPLQFRVPVYGLSQANISLSPDGATIALVAGPDPPEAPAVYIRPVGATTFRRVAGTENAAQLFWSDDSRSIAFVADGRLKKVDAAGGPPQNISEAQGFTGGTWSRDGTILFGSPKGVFRVSAEGGKPEAMTAIEKGETGHFWPSFLPDGRHFLYLAWSADAGSRALFVGSLDSKERKRLMTAESNATYVPPGYLVYHREAGLFAQPWNAKALVLDGEPVHIVDDLAFTATNGRGSFDVSRNGVLLYFQGQGGASGRAAVFATAQYGWRNRKGDQLGAAGDVGPFGDVDLAPGGKLFAVTRQDPGAPGADVWVTDWQRGATTRLTLDPADDINPVWSPDGLRVAFTTYRKGNADIYVKNANGVGAETPLLDSPANEAVEDWSKDGRYLAYKLGQDAHDDIYVFSLADKKSIPVVQGAFRKDEPQFSYDGKWIAYTSDESGAFQVYVIEFPGGKERHQVSTTGGGQPRWRQDGKELYYKASDGGVMAVDVQIGARVESGVPHRLFNLFTSVTSLDPVRHQWSVTPDGQRFFIRYPNSGTLTGGGRGTGGGVAFIYQAGGGTAGPTGAGTVFAGGPRGNGGGPGALNNLPPSGLTVIRNWTAAIKKGGS